MLQLRLLQVLQPVARAISLKRGRSTKTGGSDPTFWRSIRPKVRGVTPARHAGSVTVFRCVPDSENASCNAGCNGARIAKGGGTLGTSESTVEATQDYNPSGPPGGRSQKHPKQVR